MSAQTIQVDISADRTVRLTREFAAPPRLVWDAHTKPELASQWLGGFEGWSMAVCTIDLRVGGTGRYVMRHEPSGEEMGWTDTFTEVEPDAKPYARLGFSEIFDQDWTGGATLNTCLFKEFAPGKTRLEMTIVYSSNEAREEALKINFVEGMELSYSRADELLATGKVS